MATSAAALEELATKAEALAGRVAGRAYAARDAFGDDDASEDAVYFRLKQELLTSYCGFLAYYLCRKARGESVADHPVVRRLYELRLTFEKLRLLDAKLRHQLDKVLARADASDAAPQPNLDGVAPAEADGPYRAPRSTVAYEDKVEEASSDDGEDEAPRQKKPERQERATRARRAEMSHLMNEQSDAPDLVGSGGAEEALGTGQRAARRERKRKEQREQETYEEDAFRRVDTNKRKKKARKTADFSSSLDDLI